MSFTTPITVNGWSSHRITAPTGFSSPMNFTADSFRINAAVSDAKSLEKSRPSFISQPITLPKSWLTALLGKSTAWLGSFPSQSNPPFEFHTSVVGLPASAIATIAPAFLSSVSTASKWSCTSCDAGILNNPS